MSVRNGSRRVRSQRESVDLGTMGPALGGAYECYAHISSSKGFRKASASSFKLRLTAIIIVGHMPTHDFLRVLFFVFKITSKRLKLSQEDDQNWVHHDMGLSAMYHALFKDAKSMISMFTTIE